MLLHSIISKSTEGNAPAEDFKIEHNSGSRRVSLVAGVRKCIPYLIFCLCALVYVYPFMRFLFEGADEGTFLYGAIRVRQGQVPFRDFFEVTGLGSFYWLALFFKVFGATFLTARVLSVLTSVSAAVVMYFLARRLKTGYSAVPAVLFLATSFGPLWPAISHHNDSNLFALLSFTAFLLWTDTRRHILLFIAGILAGITTCFMATKGLLLLLSFLALVFLVRNKAKLLPSLHWLMGGYFTIAALVFAFYWRAGALSNLIYANAVWPLTQYSGVNAVPYGQGIQNFYWAAWTTALSAVVSPPIAYGIASLLILPFLLVAAAPGICCLFAVRYRSLAFNRLTLPYWLAGAALWTSEIHRKDVMHLAYGAPLLIILSFHFLSRERRKFNINTLQLLCVSTFALAAFNAFVVLAARVPVATPRGTYRSAQKDPVLEFLDTHIKRGEAIFAYPYCPMYYFLSGATNPTRFSILMYHINTDSQFRDAVRSLQESKVRYVLWDRNFDRLVKLGFPAYVPPPKERLIMEPYLARRYQLVKRINGFEILERKPESALNTTE